MLLSPLAEPIAGVHPAQLCGKGSERAMGPGWVHAPRVLHVLGRGQQLFSLLLTLLSERLMPL